MKQWKDLFRTRILERGLDYYERGHVSALKKTETGYTAAVEGSEDYDVEIVFRDGEIYDMTCTCPYAEDGTYCKHMAAVLFEIEGGEPDGELAEVHSRHIQDPEKELKDIVEKIPAEDLQSIILSLAHSDKSLYNRIMTRYGPITPQQIIRLKRRVDDIGYQYSDRSGFVNYHHAWDYTAELNVLLNENIPALLEKNCRMDAFELVNYVFREVGNRDMDDSDGGVSFVAKKCYEYWILILQGCDEQEKETMFQWFQSHQEGYVIDYLEDYITDFLWSEFHDERMLREKLRVLDEKIHSAENQNYSGNSYSAYYGRINNISARLRLMEELHYSEEEIREYRKQYRNFSEIRKMEIREYLSEEKYEEAISVLKESKVLDADKAGLVAEYSRQLIDIYESQNMEKEYVEELKYQVFQCMQDNLEYIARLKKLYSQEEWEAQRELFLENKTSSWVRYELLSEEELFERMLTKIRKNGGVHILNQYEKVLKKHLPEEVRDLYVQYVKDEAAQVSDRKAYRGLMTYLKKIAGYPDGKIMAQEIADCWKVDYRRRPAMMDELRKAGF